MTGTFAPHVTFKDGLAVTASPGLANVVGVNSYLAWPVVQYVNYSPGIRREMFSIINAYRAHLTQTLPGPGIVWGVRQEQAHGWRRARSAGNISRN